MTHHGRPPGTPTALREELAGVVSTHRGRWLAAAHALTGDHHSAEDLLQTVLVATLTCPRPLTDAAATDAYVRRSLRNRHISSWRRRRGRAECLVDQVPEPEPVLPEASRLAQRDELWGLVRRLPSAQRRAIVLRFYEDMTEAQTAEALGCSIGTVKSNTSRGVQRLRRELAIAPA